MSSLRRVAGAAAAGVLGLGMLTGCSLEPSGIETGPQAPTGLAEGTVLYFLDADGELVAAERDTGRLGTISEAVSLLLTGPGPGSSGLSTGIRETSQTRVQVTVSEDVVTLRLPLASTEVSAPGTEQIACTALVAHAQAGDSADARARLIFTDTDLAVEDARLHGCPAME